MKPRIALIRGAFLNRYEMQFYEPLVESFDMTGFASKKPFHSHFAFPVNHMLSPMDLPDVPKKMSLLNRLFIDAHYLFGLEEKLQRFDLVHTAEMYFHYTQQCLNAKNKGYVKKVIATVLENIPFNNEGIHGRKAFKQRAIAELDHIIALTERTKLSLLIEGANEKNITVIPHFIDTARFSPVSKSKNEIIHLLFCGRLERYKGVYEILFALKLLIMEGYKIHMTFVGDGTEASSLKAMESRLGIEKYITHTSASYEDMPKVYQHADIYLAPSKETETWQEQYNTTLLEAQASGLAIVTTRSGGIPENVGDAALLVQPGDVLSLATAIKTFIDNPAISEDYGKKARKRAEEVHDISIGAKKIAEVWNSVLHI